MSQAWFQVERFQPAFDRVMHKGDSRGIHKEPLHVSASASAVGSRKMSRRSGPEKEPTAPYMELQAFETHIRGLCDYLRQSYDKTARSQDRNEATPQRTIVCRRVLGTCEHTVQGGNFISLT